MSDDPEEIRRVLEEADILWSGEEVDAAIGRLAGEITARLAGAAPVVCTVMNGGLIFAGKLLPQLRFPLEADYLHVTRYGHRLYGGGLDWKVKPSRDLRGRTVLLLDDILDEGATLAAVVDYCRGEGAREVLVAVLVAKMHDRKLPQAPAADFVGLEAEDRYLFGYGMDYKGWWRNAPGIFALRSK